MDANNYRGARGVFAWSFHSQETGERVTSADLFFSEALAWFGDPDPEGVLGFTKETGSTERSSKRSLAAAFMRQPG